MDKYVYRVMNEYEEACKIIMCKDYFDWAPWYALPKYDYFFGRDGLDTIATHLTKGNYVHTPWISCSKELDILKNFATEQTDRKPLLALIKEHSKTTLDCDKIKELINLVLNKEITYEQFIKKVRLVHFYELKKVVLDFSESRDKLYEMFINFGMVNKKTGDIRYKEFTREVNYAKANKELLILGEVPDYDVTILTPLQYEVLYGLKNNNSIKEINEDIVNIIRQDLNVSTYISETDFKIENNLYGITKELFSSLDDYEKRIFEVLYVKRLPIYNWKFSCENKKIYLNIQKKVLEKVVNLMNEKRLLGLNPNIRTIEEDKKLIKIS